MKVIRYILIALALGLSSTAWAQKIELRGIICVQRSLPKEATVEYVSDVLIEHPNAKPTVSDTQGTFTLSIIGLARGSQIGISIKPQGKYRDYVVVNEHEISNITLGRTTPVQVYICKRKELEERKAELIGINIDRYQRARQTKLAQLKNHVAELESDHQHQSLLYRHVLDSMQRLSREQEAMLRHIREYADTFVRINLEGADSTYREAYSLFERGELDSVSNYLDQSFDYKSEYEYLQKLEQESKVYQEAKQAFEEATQKRNEYTRSVKDLLLRKCLLMAQTHGLRSERDQAILRYRQALELDPKNHKVLFDYASYLQSIGRFSEAQHLYSTLLTELREHQGSHPETYILRSQASLLYNLGLNAKSQGQFASAEQYDAEALALWEQLAKQDLEHLPGLVLALNGLGADHYMQQRLGEAEALYLRSLEILEQGKLGNNRTQQSYLVQTLNNLGTCAYTAGRGEAAETYYLKALSLQEALAELHPQLYKRDLYSTLHNLGTCAQSRQQDEDAERYYRRGIEIARLLLSENPEAYESSFAISLHHLALTISKQGRHSEAEAYHREALSIRQRLYAREPRRHWGALSTTMAFLSENLYRQGRWSEATQQQRELIKFMEQAQAPEENKFTAIGNLVYFLVGSGEYTEAEQKARTALALQPKAHWIKPHLAVALLLEGRYEEARAAFDELTNLKHNGRRLDTLIAKGLEHLLRLGAIPQEHRGEVLQTIQRIKEQAPSPNTSRS
ncbi:tetratricopeptide repeat protein [Porphyromonas sp. COT-239 OH1446]|uniref:tetratricopeptide repeat protein n=1 Tax=Porphyromonas sp. COT-239 OH1446 TaxID=1515613 RepID=UPI00052D372D|nr:tetratricopeptide repeat protein [Porphyromonas sp. COT-239 OH1446]KGN70160.1 hypothetical protein HQ37_03675 [Porphyromonas sp. COT-239 OH1446]